MTLTAIATNPLGCFSNLNTSASSRSDVGFLAVTYIRLAPQGGPRPTPIRRKPEFPLRGVTAKSEAILGIKDHCVKALYALSAPALPRWATPLAYTVGRESIQPRKPHTKPERNRIVTKDYIAVDVDGHIMEPPDLFEKNIEAKYRDQGVQAGGGRRGNRASGDGQRVAGRHPTPGNGVRCMERWTSRLRTTWGRRCTTRMRWWQGACVPEARLKVMDEEGIDVALFLPVAGTRLGEFLRGRGPGGGALPGVQRLANRLLQDGPEQAGTPIAHISFMDVEQAVEETRRVAGLGAKGLDDAGFPATQRTAVRRAGLRSDSGRRRRVWGCRSGYTCTGAGHGSAGTTSTRIRGRRPGGGGS